MKEGDRIDSNYTYKCANCNALIRICHRHVTRPIECSKNGDAYRPCCSECYEKKRTETKQSRDQKAQQKIAPAPQIPININVNNSGNNFTINVPVTVPTTGELNQQVTNHVSTAEIKEDHSQSVLWEDMTQDEKNAHETLVNEDPKNYIAYIYYVPYAMGDTVERNFQLRLLLEFLFDFDFSDKLEREKKKFIENLRLIEKLSTNINSAEYVLQIQQRISRTQQWCKHKYPEVGCAILDIVMGHLFDSELLCVQELTHSVLLAALISEYKFMNSATIKWKLIISENNPDSASISRKFNGDEVVFEVPPFLLNYSTRFTKAFETIVNRRVLTVQRFQREAEIMRVQDRVKYPQLRNVIDKAYSELSQHASVLKLPRSENNESDDDFLCCESPRETPKAVHTEEVCFFS